MPAWVPGYPHDEPGCFDPTFMQWMKDSLAGRLPHIAGSDLVHVRGAWVPDKSAEDQRVNEQRVSCWSAYHDRKPTSESARDASVESDGSNGMPYVTHLPNGIDLFLVIQSANGTKKRNARNHWGPQVLTLLPTDRERDTTGVVAIERIP